MLSSGIMITGLRTWPENGPKGFQRQMLLKKEVSSVIMFPNFSTCLFSKNTVLFLYDFRYFSVLVFLFFLVGHKELTYSKKILHTYLNLTGHEVTMRSCCKFSNFAHSSLSPPYSLQLGTLQWAVHFSPHLKDTTTHWVGAGKSGLASTNLCAPPCGRWCLTLMVSHWRHPESVQSVSDLIVFCWLCMTGQKQWDRKGEKVK